MKKGMEIVELAQEIQRQAETKKDYIVDTRGVTAIPSSRFSLSFGENDYGLTRWGHKQLGEVLGIPKPYYDRMLEKTPLLLADNINHWLSNEPKNRLVRTLDGNIRGILSDRYRPLDYTELAEYALSKIQSMDCKIESCGLTETRLYLKALFPKFEGEVAPGDVVQLGLVISNSEVGAGSVRIEPLIYRLVCSNGMIGESAIRKFHIEKGRHNIGEFLRDETRIQMDRAFWMQLSDVIDKTFTQKYFDDEVAKLKSAKDEKIEGDIVKAVELTAKKLDIEKSHQSSILSHLASGGDLSRWGMVNAITRHSQDIEDYDTATKFERLGGKVLELSRSQWQEVATA